MKNYRKISFAFFFFRTKLIMIKLCQRGKTLSTSFSLISFDKGQQNAMTTSIIQTESESNEKRHENCLTA